jgi:phthiocerol/phenolphthiocerol synthesis type-I polyketide synthase D
MSAMPTRIDPDTPLTRLGLDSLLALRMRALVQHDFGVPLPAALLLRGASLTDVVRYLADHAGIESCVQRTGSVRRVAPRDPTERWVTLVWQNVLGHNNFGVLDHVSFTASQSNALCEALSTRLGTVPGALFDTPTIAAMSDLVRSEFEESPQGCVRMLRSAGDGDPVFLFHPAGGPTSVYQPMVAELPAGFPVLGFERLEDLDTVEDKALRYVDLLRDIRPRGPYVLGGWSFGGCLAYEVAQKLTAQGETVDLVFLIDTILPLPDDSTDPQELLLRRFERFCAHIRDTYDVHFDIPRDTLAALPEAEQIREMIRQLTAAVPDLRAATLRHQYTSYVDARVAERYFPAPYDGRVLLLRAGRPHPLTTALDPRYLRTDEALGWDEHCSKLNVVRVPGDHVSMVDPPNVTVLAAEISAALKQLGWPL